MGNNLNVLYKGKLIAGLARKHYFTFYGDYDLPTEDEVEKEVNNSRKHIESTIVGYAAWLAAQDEGTNLTEYMDDIVTSIKDLLDNFEYDVSIAARNWVIRDLVQYDEDGISNDIEVIDDNELYRREQQEEKFVEAKKQMYADLHKKLEKVNWDAVEDQTGEVDLDFEKDACDPLEAVDIVSLAQKDAKTENEGLEDWDKDTLVGPEWEEPDENKCGSIKIGEKVTKGW